MNIVWRLLRKNISGAQIGGYALANLVGLSIVLIGLQFGRDINSVYSDQDSFLSKDYLIISKKVTTVNTLGMGGSTTFSAEDIADLEEQPWVRKVGEFEANNYDVYASLSFDGRSMSTALFFESIPDEFMDINPTEWSFDSTQVTVPIIMSKDYLTLYNFGFATSRGLPQLSEAATSRAPITIILRGNGLEGRYQGHIVGFSSRLNTIAVPQSFMEWANRTYAPGVKVEPSRLIIDVSRPGDPAIARYLDDNGYQSAGDKADNSKAPAFFTLVTWVVISVGAVICILAVVILLLSIFLLLQKNRQKLHELMLLGYSPWQVSRHYYALIGTVNVAVLIVSVVAMIVASAGWSEPLKALDVQGTSVWPVVAIGVAIMALITAINFIAIARTIRRYFRQ